MSKTWNQGCKVVMEAFDKAPNHTLNSFELRSIPGTLNALGRMSDLRLKHGAIFERKEVQGSNIYQWTFKGYAPPSPQMEMSL